MIYILYGQDDFSLQEELSRIRSSLGDAMLDVNTSFLEGSQTTPQEVINACDTVPFLGQHRLVIVNHLLRRFEAPRGLRERPSPAPPLGPWQQFADYVKNIPPTTVLAIIDGPLVGENRLFEALKPQAKVQEFRLLRHNAVPAWIGRRARDKGVTISPAGIRVLAASMGRDLWALDRELDKLACYSLGGQVDEDDVRSLVGPVRDLTVFALVDAVLEGNGAEALKVLRQLQAMGAEAGYLLAMLARQYRFVLQAKQMRQEGASADRIGRELGISNEFVLRKVIGQSNKSTLGALKGAFKRMLEADLAIKRGQQGEELALELLVGELGRAGTA